MTEKRHPTYLCVAARDASGKAAYASRFISNGRGRLPRAQQCDTPVIGTDLYPTLLELAGLPLRPNQHLDGLSLVPLLKGQTLPARPLFWHYPHYGNQGGEPSSIITRGKWKLIHYLEDQRYELYDIEGDISETHNVIEQHPQIQESLTRELKSWIAEMDARQPTPNPNFDLEKTKQRKNQHSRQTKTVS